MATTEKQIAETIAHLMEEQGYSVASFAEVTGIPYNTLKRRINTGRDLRIDELNAFAEALGVETRELMRRAEVQQRAAA